MKYLVLSCQDYSLSVCSKILLGGFIGLSLTVGDVRGAPNLPHTPPKGIVVQKDEGTIHKEGEQDMGLIKDAGHKVADAAHHAKDVIVEKAHNAGEAIKHGYEVTKEKAAELAHKAGDALHSAKEGADDMAHKAADKTANVWEKTKEAAHEAKEGAKEKISHASDSVNDKIQEKTRH